MHIKLKEMDQIKLHLAGFLKRSQNTKKRLKQSQSLIRILR